MCGAPTRFDCSQRGAAHAAGFPRPRPGDAAGSETCMPCPGDATRQPAARGWGRRPSRPAASGWAQGRSRVLPGRGGACFRTWCGGRVRTAMMLADPVLAATRCAWGACPVCVGACCVGKKPSIAKGHCTGRRPVSIGVGLPRSSAARCAEPRVGAGENTHGARRRSARTSRAPRGRLPGAA